MRVIHNTNRKQLYKIFVSHLRVLVNHLSVGNVFHEPLDIFKLKYKQVIAVCTTTTDSLFESIQFKMTVTANQNLLIQKRLQLG